MTQFNHEENLNARAQLFKALGHPTRLLILNLIREKSRHGEELAEILKLKPATISHHLAKLSEAGLVQAKKDQYYQVYSLVVKNLKISLLDMIQLPQPDIHAEVETDAYRVKVLNTFFKRGQLLQIPAQLKKRMIIYEKLVEEFEIGRKYEEREVNQILVDFHEDVASLRRGLIEVKLMDRDKSGYWRT